MRKSIMIGVFAISVLMFASFALAVNGATTTIGTSERATSPIADSEQALAGNVTEINLNSDAITQTWQGYFGNVSGTITLEDASGDVMYNWSAASPTGEVLASVNQTVDWANIACASSINITTLETQYNIGSGTDGVDETFTGSTGAVTIAGVSLSNCANTSIYDETGASGVDFQELLLWDGDAAVFASILEEDALGFNNVTYDFEMLVLEDGHGADVAETTYYFFVELN